jgi:hypothetical protein
MPDEVTTQSAATPEVEEAAAAFYGDYLKLKAFHVRLSGMMSYRGRNAEFDAGLKRLVGGQRKLMFQLRNLYVEAYDLLPADKRAEVFRWIVSVTGQLKAFASELGGLGIAPLVIVAGVLITAATATALVAWHRAITAQGKALDNQARMIPLVEAGIVDPSVLKPVAPALGLSGVIGNLSSVLLIVGLIYAAVKLFGDRAK